MMIPGYGCETADEAALQHNISMKTGEESDEDFRLVLGEYNIVEPTTEHEAHVMFQGVANFLELLADGPCIASSGYALAAELVLEHGRVINRLMRDPNEPHFLLWLLNQVDQENYFLFREFFNDIKATGSGR